MNFLKAYLLLIFFLLCSVIPSQTRKAPIAKFSFNGANEADEINGKKAKLVNVNFTKDRFNNENNAIYLFGNLDSYVSLGTHTYLKPKTGSISLWVKVDMKNSKGRGGECNPILLTKNTSTDDYYESYAIYYEYMTDRMTAAASLDSTMQVSIYSKGEFKRFTWHHLVIIYNKDSLVFYVDGELAGWHLKGFETRFLESDSVVLGHSANKKNLRSTNGAVDDISFYDYVLTKDEVVELYNAPNPNRNRVVLNWLLAVTGFCLIIVCIYYFIKYRLNLNIKKEKQHLELYNNVLEMELRVNRALMNPHFMFNSLNNLHNYILTHNIDKASDYLVKFSKLIRKILDSNMSNVISLEMEIELIERYLEIEALRFKEEINHAIILDAKVFPSAITIPILMLQPFIENSVWHGFRDKAGEKIIKVTFSLYQDHYLLCVIDDNGTGRKKAQPREKKSLSTNFVIQRLALLNKLHGLSCSLNIEDKPESGGTIVRITLPILNK